MTSKTLTFKSDELYQLLGELALPPWTAPNGTLVGVGWDCALIAQRIIERIESIAIEHDD